MGHRQRIWARKIREQLLNELGRFCKKCKTTKNLTFDVIIPDGKRHEDGHHKIEWSWRMSFYRQQHFNGNLQVLCEHCNNLKRNALELYELEPPDNPF